MNIDELTIRQAREIASLLGSSGAPVLEPPQFQGKVIAQFIGRFIFVCDLSIRGDYCYLTNVQNVRYFSQRKNGLAGLAFDGPCSSDKLDKWPDQIVPLNKLGPVMSVNNEAWK